jgi:hypothetical protein
MASYILERVDTKTGERRISRLVTRPTQEQMKTKGLATYTLRRPDGSMLKRFRVVLNRNGNPKVETETPVNLEGITTVNLKRMERAYERIVKYWPAKAADVRRVHAEVVAREAFAAVNDDELQVDDEVM